VNASVPKGLAIPAPQLQSVDYAKNVVEFEQNFFKIRNLQIITQKTKDRTTRTPLKTGVNASVPKGLTIPAPQLQSVDYAKNVASSNRIFSRLGNSICVAHLVYIHVHRGSE
jgi:hypothetical protein